MRAKSSDPPAVLTPVEGEGRGGGPAGGASDCRAALRKIWARPKGAPAKAAHPRSPKWGRSGQAPAPPLCWGTVWLQHVEVDSAAAVSLLHSTLLPQSPFLKENLSGTFLLGARVGQGKFSVSNKRQNIEQSMDLGPSNNNNKEKQQQQGVVKWPSAVADVHTACSWGWKGSPRAPVSVLTLFSVSVAMDSLDPSLS